MLEKSLEEPDSPLIASLSSRKFMQNSVEPELTAGTNECENSNVQNKETANLEAAMQEELPHILVGKKSNLLEISTEQKAPISVSATPPSEVDNSGLVSAIDPHGFSMTSQGDDESTEPSSDSTTIPPSENTHSTSQTYDRPREVIQLQDTLLHDIQDDAFCSDSVKVVKVAYETPPTLLIERDISIRKTQVAVAMSEDTVRKVEELTVELNKLKVELELAHSTCHDAEKHSIGTSLACDGDSLRWEDDLRQAEEELNQLVKKISSVKEMKSMLDTSTGLLLKLKNELAGYVEAKPIDEEAQGNITQRSLHSKVILPTRGLEECLVSLDKVRDEVCALNVAAASLKTELIKAKTALATMQQMEVMSSITAASLKGEIQLAKRELEAVEAKEKKSRNGMLGLRRNMEDTAQEADEARSITREAQEKVRNAKEDMEHAKSGLNTMEFRLQGVLKEMEATKESERLANDALRLFDNVLAVDIEEQGSQMITLDLDEYQSLIEKSSQAEELVHERSASVIAQAKIAKESESRTLSTLSETYKVLEQRKHALVAATERADRATEGKLAMEQELRKWREENEQRRKAGEASKSELIPSITSMIFVECSGDTKSTSKDDSYASVHPLLDMSARSSPNDSALFTKKKRKKLSFFPRITMFFTRKKSKASI